MENTFKKTETILNRLKNLHEDHLSSFDKDELPDLEKQSLERKLEVDRLMESVNEFVKMAAHKDEAAAESMLRTLNDHVTLLLEQNNALETKVKAFREEIKKGMDQVSKGKKVIGSYRSSTAVLNTPRVISVTN